MIHVCVGCREVDRTSPPQKVMPRMILNYKSEVICEPCKKSLEDHLVTQWTLWMAPSDDSPAVYLGTAAGLIRKGPAIKGERP